MYCKYPVKHCSYFLPPIPCDITVIYFIYPYAIITQYIVTVFTLNSYGFDHLRMKKWRILYYLHLFLL